MPQAWRLTRSHRGAFDGELNVAPHVAPMRFELRRKDKSVNLRLPEPLLNAVRERAEQAGMPYQRFMRLAIERALQDVKTR